MHSIDLKIASNVLLCFMLHKSLGTVALTVGVFVQVFVDNAVPQNSTLHVFFFDVTSFFKDNGFVAVFVTVGGNVLATLHAVDSFDVGVFALKKFFRCAALQIVCMQVACTGRADKGVFLSVLLF